MVNEVTKEKKRDTLKIIKNQMEKLFPQIFLS